MAAQFPGIKPSERSFRSGQYPVKAYRALSGAIVKRAFGNRPYGYEIQLGFTNINDASTKELLDHYDNTRGGFERFTLPTNLFVGMSAELMGKIQAPTQIQWEYAQPPEVNSIYPGLSTVKVVLTGELSYQ